jgi:hypothetical protein
MLTVGVMASPATNATVLSKSLFLMACSSVVSLARAADTLRLDWETREREHRSDIGAIWCDAYRLSFILNSRTHRRASNLSKSSYFAATKVRACPIASGIATKVPAITLRAKQPSLNGRPKIPLLRQSRVRAYRRSSARMNQRFTTDGLRHVCRRNRSASMFVIDDVEITYLPGCD